MSRKKTTLSDPVAHPGVSDGRITDCGDSVSNVEPHADNLKTQHPSEQAALPASGVYGQLLDDLAAVIAPLQELHQQAVEALSPTVRDILRAGSRDVGVIEHSLDCLLDHACIPEGLALFKSLCRHYWQIDPHATAAYINAYREMWDSDDHETEEAELSGNLPNDQEINT